jgi:hypothetical protein
MISKWKVAAIIITTVAKMAFVSPAFAQSFDPEIGTGNVLMLNNQALFPTSKRLFSRAASMPSRWRRACKQELLRKTRRIPVAEVLDITKTFEFTKT